MNYKSTLLQIFFVLLSVTAFSQAGTLDNTFGTNGIVLYDSGVGHDNAYDVHVYEDTSMIVNGTQMATGYVSSGVLQKYTSDGSVDTSWGTNSKIVFQYGVDTYPYTMIVLSDGKILVSGVDYVTASDAEFFAARFNPDGTPDVTFNGNGRWIGSYTTYEEVCETMTVQADGKIVLAGRTYSGSFSQLLFARLNTDGTLDNTFGTNGYTEINASVQDERINGLGILSNGDIVGLGYGYESAPWFGEFVYMAKLNASGNPVAGFGTNGVLIPTIFTDISIAYDCIVVNDSILVTGKMNDAANNQEIFLTKLDASGTADPNFGSAGITVLGVDPVTVGYQIMLGMDGKFYACGTTGLGGMSDRDFLLVRYNYDGTLDQTFNSTAYVVTPIRPDWDEANGIDMQADGKIVLAGMSSGLTTSGDNDRALTRYLNDYAPPSFTANFEATPTIVCEGNTVNFTDLSQGNPTNWEWTFEGGIPSTSVQQNPVVTYNTLGTYDVKLVISDGTQEDSLTKIDYIQVDVMPSQPNQPSGQLNVCQTYDVEYTTDPVAYANSYEWEVLPSDAGTITGSDTVGYFESSDSWVGSYTVKVRPVGTCGTGAWSPELQCELFQNPEIFQLTGEGGYCQGSQGAELILEGSEVGFDYELYLDNVPTGNLMTGTGNALNFGFFTDEGIYKASGYSGSCFEFMLGSIWVHEVFPPTQPATPSGPEEVCNNDSTVYTTTPDPDVSNYIWTLAPPEAGILYQMHDTATVKWAEMFDEIATLSVVAENDCGTSIPSENLLINVFDAPIPVITGLELVCNDEEADYQTTDNPGSIYSWEVMGGIIIAGGGTNQITVLWGAPGMGYVKVTEENADGCITTTDEYEVTIDDCPFIREADMSIVNIYPNPAKEKLNIVFENNIQDKNIKILNSLGEVIDVINIKAGMNKYTLNTKNYNSGLYFIQLIESDQMQLTKRFIIE